ncbi:hypothetical protein SmJEL517_g05682 [Synchytrium microbalum]|uniref:Uncharacterized protein n=1 Tax=Synchytrium microbalum TaxID=1806994 RepID=A0A507BT90_9FUNG|nr:uncharacterized protein SmJEL517_g05682 [Synchytrium microbalum]TPX30842.1 hypothetical protein SmJEL517_g05682 [Synchytrium microbalum]
MATDADSTKRSRKAVALAWVSSVLEQANISVDPARNLMDELRAGQLPCRIINHLLPGSIESFNHSDSPFSVVENLNAFKATSSKYGVEKKYLVSPLDFLSGDPRGDETMISHLLALALAASSHNLTVNGFNADETRSLLVNVPATEWSPEPKHTIFSSTQDTPNADIPPSGQLSRRASHDFIPLAEDTDPSLQRIYAKIDSVDVTQGKLLKGQIDMKLKLERADQRDSTLHQKVDLLSNGLLGAFDAMFKRLHDLEASQKELLEKVSEMSKTRPASSYAESPAEDDDGRGHARRPYGKLSHLSPDVATSNDSFAISPAKLDSAPSTLTLSSPTAPKLFAKLPPEVLNAGLTKAEMMRLSVVYELIETESDYVKDLGTMINYHKAQMMKGSLLPEAEIQQLFANVDQLLVANQEFLVKLVARKEANVVIQEIGDVIADCADSFKVYTQYCGNYPIAMKLVHSLQARPDFKPLLEKWMNSPECRGLSLESFLIKPVQRICKYPLLLKELLRHTDKSSKDHLNLTTAEEKIAAVVTIVNEGTRALGERERMITLQGRIDSPIPLALEDKKLIRDGALIQIIAGGKAKDRHIFLFNDTMLICKTAVKGRYPLENQYMLAELILKTEVKPGTVVAESIPKGHRWVFQLLLVGEKKETILLSAATEEEKVKWCDLFADACKKAIEEAAKDHRSGKRISALPLSALSRQMSDRVPGRPQLGSRTVRGPTAGGVHRNVSVSTTKTKWGTVRMKSVTQPSPTGEEMTEVQPPEIEPEMVDINGVVWKRALSAFGMTYYYNTHTRESLWRLPDGYIILDPETGKPVDLTTDPVFGEPDQVDAASTDEEIASGDYPMLENVDGHPEWKKVDRGEGIVYYFRVDTQETSWFAPGAEEA